MDGQSILTRLQSGEHLRCVAGRIRSLNGNGYQGRGLDFYLGDEALKPNASRVLGRMEAEGLIRFMRGDNGEFSYELTKKGMEIKS